MTANRNTCSPNRPVNWPAYRKAARRSGDTRGTDLNMAGVVDFAVFNADFNSFAPLYKFTVV